MTEEFQFRNPVKQLGFAQINHVVTMDLALSDGAKITFQLYLKYAHQKESCWPSIQRIAEERGKTTTTISRHNGELARLGYITRQRRMGRTSLTIIEDVEQIPRLQELASTKLQKRDDHKNVTTNITKMSRSTLQKRNAEEESLKDNQEKNNPPRGKQSRVSAGTKRKQPDVPVAVEVFQSETGYYPRKSWFGDLEQIEDLDRWRSVVHQWVGLGYNPKNVARMYECYQANEIPTVKGAKYESSSGVKSQPATPEVRAAFRDHFAAKRRAAELEAVRAGAGPEG